jgi:DNA (cytosine-5)-methyltransferase 1
VFVVAHLGDAQRAAKVLFERESVQRNPAPRREARQGAAASVGGGTYLGNAEGGALDAPYLTCSNIDSHVNNQTPLVAQQVKCATGDITHALTTRSAAEEDGTGRGTPLVPAVFKVRGGVEREDGVQAVAQPAATAMQVRRLTPVECERLQGFPDGYTDIPWRKSPEAPDGPRYKALGNSMAVPCMAWIGKRIAEVDRGD